MSYPLVPIANQNEIYLIIFLIFRFFGENKKPPVNTDSVKSVFTSGLSKYVRIFTNCLNTRTYIGFTITLFQFDQADRRTVLLSFNKIVALLEHKCQFVNGGDFSTK